MGVNIEESNFSLRGKLEENNQKYGIKGKQILESNSVNEVRSLINSDRKNFIINGNFDIWQRNTTQTNISGYQTADRWAMVKPENIATGTSIFRQSTDVPDFTNSIYSLEHIITDPVLLNGNTNRWPELITSVELAIPGNQYPISINNYTLSFYAKTTTPNKKISIRISFKDNLNTNSTGTLIIPWTEFKNNASSDWIKYEYTFCIEQQSLSITNSLLEIAISSNEFGNGSLKLSRVQLEEGNNATDFEYRPIAEELALCQRYYQKSYDLGIIPGTINSNGEIKEYSTRNSSSESPGHIFKNRMRTVPSVVLYSPITGLIGNVENSGNKTASAINIGETGFSHINISSGTILSSTSYHYTADAEL